LLEYRADYAMEGLAAIHVKCRRTAFAVGEQECRDQ